MRPKLNPGEIYYIDFNDSIGNEISDRRPALIISPREFNIINKMPVVLPITQGVSNYSRENNFTYHLSGITEKTNGVVRCDLIKTVDFKVRNPEYIEFLSKYHLNEILQKVAILLFPTLFGME